MIPMNPLISVIVPIYNAEKSLENCIQSILSQTYNNFELILIDDGSRDNSFFLCKQIADRDARIYVVHQDNAGASAARNRGLELAHGEWIVFVDSDDSVSPDYLINLSTTMKDEHTVLGVCGYRVFYNGKFSHNKVFRNGGYLLRDSSSLFHKICIHKYGFPWGKTYLKKIIDRHSLRFDENVCIAEDLLFMLKYMMHCQTDTNAKIEFSEKCDYNYMIHKGSLSTSCSSFDKEWYSYQEYKNTIVLLNDRLHVDSNTSELLLNKTAYYTDRCLNAIFCCSCNNQDRIAKLNMLDRIEYNKYKKCNTIFESFLKYLFVHKIWYPLCWIRTRV